MAADNAMVVFFLAPEFYRRSILQMKGARNLYFMRHEKGFAVRRFQAASWAVVRMISSD